jgi:hypothetical protein
MLKIICFICLSFSLLAADTYIGFGPAISSESTDMNYWFSAGRYFHRGSFDTKIKADFSSDFKNNKFLSGSLGFNYYFISDMLLAGFDFGFGSDFDKFGFVGGVSAGLAVAERTFLIEPSLQVVLKEKMPFVVCLKVGMLFGKGE